MSKDSWNFLIITTDEERYPPVYEDQAIREFRENHLKTAVRMRERGLTFHGHYAASTACSPSRACIYTGQYPSLHGVTQTSGMAKAWYDPSMFYLDPNTVPTLGNYFRAGGYRTFYHGKWHLSYPDVVMPGTKNPLQTTTNDGTPIPWAEGIYRMSNRLAPFGFDGWIGPDPHGAAQADMGINRDRGFANQTITLLDALEQDKSEQPFLIVCSFTNPHDIVFFGLPWLSFGYNYDFPDVIKELPFELPPTRFEDLSTKPFCQKDYADKYGEMFFRNPTIPQYYQLYYYLQMRVDEEIGRVYTRLENSRFFENTIVIYTSDHGDMLGAHGGMHQKWYNAYEETLHVPMIVSNPQIFERAKNTNVLSSHVDIIPTLLGLADIPEAQTAEKLKSSHTDVHRLPGHDLSQLILSAGDSGQSDTALYFMTDDEVSEGLTQTNPRGNPYEPIREPAHVESVITRMQGDDGKMATWKFSRYYSNPKFWGSTMNPDQAYDPESEGGPAEFELYNLGADPMEVHNLTHGAAAKKASKETIQRMADLLGEQRALKRKHPTPQTKHGEN